MAAATSLTSAAAVASSPQIFTDVGLSSSASSESIKQRKETVQTVAAMALLYSELEEMRANEEKDSQATPPPEGVVFGPSDVFLLSIEMICSAHEVLVTGLMRQKVHEGRIRQHGEDVVAESPLFPCFTHFFPPGGDVPSLFGAVLNRYADYISTLGSINTDAHTTQIFQLAAWLLFKVLDVHPFIDGNGRIARLLANRVLAMIFPFPVPISTAAVQNIEGTSPINVRMEVVLERAGVASQPWVQWRRVSDLRQLYLLLVEACRYRPKTKDQPIEMCALLIENGWSYWQVALAAIPAELLVSQ